MNMSWEGLFMTGPKLKAKVVPVTKPQATSRRCTACERMVPVSDFETKGKRESGSIKYGSNCLPCAAKRNREVRARKRGGVL